MNYAPKEDDWGARVEVNEDEWQELNEIKARWDWLIENCWRFESVDRDLIWDVNTSYHSLSELIADRMKHK